MFSGQTQTPYLSHNVQRHLHKCLAKGQGAPRANTWVLSTTGVQMYVHASQFKGTGSAWVNPDWNGVKEKLWEKSLLFCSMSLKGGLDSGAEPESGDRHMIQDIYNKGLLLILPYPTPSLGSMYTARTRKRNRRNELTTREPRTTRDHRTTRDPGMSSERALQCKRVFSPFVQRTKALEEDVSPGLMSLVARAWVAVSAPAWAGGGTRPSWGRQVGWHWSQDARPLCLPLSGDSNNGPGRTQQARHRRRSYRVRALWRKEILLRASQTAPHVQTQQPHGAGLPRILHLLGILLVALLKCLMSSRRALPSRCAGLHSSVAVLGRSQNRSSQGRAVSPGIRPLCH